MFQTDSSNSIFQLAAELVTNTSRHIFLTGKAGTGKTTFLKYIRGRLNKKTIVVAPTGVAAINAGGVTMHSFFQLPFGPYVPRSIAPRFGEAGSDTTDKHSLFKNIRFNTEKRELLQELELLIIDEVSMVRCDMLDAIDAILRQFRKNPFVPFGGVQVLYIGDLFQLPPVVSDTEWDILQECYKSPFFFNAKIIEEAPPLYIELKKIYRQNEQHFIDVLNAVRTNTLNAEQLQVLNDRFDPDFVPVDEKYITLTTHNRRADAINRTELSKLPGTEYIFKGEVKNEFSEKSFPTDIELPLRVGAQVMFIKNDPSPEKRFYNGKLATVTSISDEEIVVLVDGNELKLEKETWKNIRYTYEGGDAGIQEEELGSFTQFPIRHAWAITIHKSQGLTFERAIIDAGASFAAGQVYVALSRCTSLEGLVLYSFINRSAISTDHRVLEFARKEVAALELEKVLEKEKLRYLFAQLNKAFDWQRVTVSISEFTSNVPMKHLVVPAKTRELIGMMLPKAKAQQLVAEKFRLQIEQLFDQFMETRETEAVVERGSKAVAYFSNALCMELLVPLQAHLSEMREDKKAKRYVEYLSKLESVIWQHLLRLVELRFGDDELWRGSKDNIARFAPESGKSGTGKTKKKAKAVKGGSAIESLNLYIKGMNLAEIALERSLSESTVIGHLGGFVSSGKVDIYRLIDKEKVDAIAGAIAELGSSYMTPIKERLGELVSYEDIRLVLYYHQPKTPLMAPPSTEIV